MRFWLSSFIILILSCNGRNIPDVSNIKADLELQRFDEDFFSVDTLRIDQSLEQSASKNILVFCRTLFLISWLCRPSQIAQKQLKSNWSPSFNRIGK